MSTAFPHLAAEAWGLYLEDRLEGDARLRVEDHARACDDCRGALLAIDPSRAFRLAPEPAVDPAWADGFWEELQPQLGARAPRRARRIPWAAAAAAALLAASWLIVGSREAEAPRPDPCAAPLVAKLHLTQAECEALYGREIEAEEREVIVVRELDLRDLP